MRSALQVDTGLIYDITGRRSAPLGGELLNRAGIIGAGQHQTLSRFPPRDARRCTSAAMRRVSMGYR